MTATISSNERFRAILDLQERSYSAGYGYRQGAGAWYPPAPGYQGAGGVGRHGRGGKNRQPGGRQGLGRGGRGKATFGGQGQCWPLPYMPAVAAPASLLPSPPSRDPAPAPAPAPPTLPPPIAPAAPAAPAVAISSNKAAAAALRAQKHKRPKTVPAAMIDTDSHPQNIMDAQPATSVPTTNITAVKPPTVAQHGTTVNIHHTAGYKTCPVPQRKGPKHHGGQPNQPPPVYPPVGDPVQHQAFLSTPSKRQSTRSRQQGRSIAQDFGITEGTRELTGSGKTVLMRASVLLLKSFGWHFWQLSDLPTLCLHVEEVHAHSVPAVMKLIVPDLLLSSCRSTS